MTSQKRVRPKSGSITQERLKQLFTYNLDGTFTCKEAACTYQNKRTVGTIVPSPATHGRYRYARFDGANERVHRMIFLYHHGYIPEMIDHINCDITDNRIENLREATRTENGANRKPTRRAVSGYKGIHWCRTRRKWVSQIKKNGENFYLGQFDDPIEAAKAYDQSALAIHGEFANVNFKDIR